MSPAPYRHPLQARLIWLRRKCLHLLHWHSRALIWAALAVGVLWALGAVWLQWWFFPHLPEYRPRLVAELSQRVGRPISIGQVEGGWRGVLPYLSFQQLSLRHNDGRVALNLAEVEATLSWWPLLLGDLRFDKLTLLQPDLQLTRGSDGVIRLAGLPLNETGRQGSLTDWLLRQHDVAIVDGRISWRDDLRQAPLLQLEQVDLSLENRLFGQHEAELSATPPAALAQPFQLEASWRGDDLAQLDQWQGSVSTVLDKVDMAAWGQWLPYPVALRRGQGRLEIKLAFEGLRPTAVDARLALRDVLVRLSPELAPLEVNALSGSVRWRDRDGERELTLGDLKLRADGGKLLDGSQATLVLHKEGGGQFSAHGVTLSGLASLPPALPLPTVLRQALGGMRPSGRLDRLNASWKGDWREPQSYDGRVGFSGLGLLAPAPWPSLGPVDGELTFSESKGSLALRGQRFKLSSSTVFEQPLHLDRIRLALDWSRMGKQWVVKLSDFSASNADLEAQAQATWRWPGTGLGNLDLKAAVPRLTAGKVADYLPIMLGNDTRHWLRQSLTAGEARDARFTLNGPLAGFPFTDGKAGVWEVVTQAKGVTLDYSDGWPAMSGIDGEVRIVGNRLTVAAGGQILGARVSDALAVIDDLELSPSVRIEGAAEGQTAEFLRYIAQSPLDASLDGMGSAARAAGEGKLSIKLDIPFEDVDATKLAGSYRFAGNQLQVGEKLPEITDLQGELTFTESKVSANALQGRTLGGAFRADLSTSDSGVVQMRASGRADVGLAAKRYSLPLADRLVGMTDYRVQLDLPEQGWGVQLDAPLKDVRLDLPAPLGKAMGEVRPLRLVLDNAGQTENWKVALGSQLNAEVQLAAATDHEWQVERGEVRLGGGVPNNANRGLWLTGTLPELALDPWLALLEGAGGKAASGMVLAGIELRAGKLMALGSQLDDLALRAVPGKDGAWQLTASGKQVEGRLAWSPQGKGKVHARFARLVLPLPDAPGAPAGGGFGNQSLPALDIVAEDFHYRGHALGRLDVKAQQQRENWLIESLTLSNPDGRLNMQGVWQPLGEDAGTKVRLDIASDNVGKLLGRFGYPETVRRGEGSLRGDLAWRGSPLAPDYPSMSGKFSIKAESGQFAKVEPGMGRLLGILSLQSLQRRLTLDFRDVFSEGFAFDRIEGDSKVVRGVMTTDNLTIVGPAAQVLFRGETDIGRETQKLRVRIVPTVGDSFAVGAGVALANPLVGVGAFLLQRVLKDPLGQMVAYEYDITGTWADPQYSKVGAAGGSK